MRSRLAAACALLACGVAAGGGVASGSPASGARRFASPAPLRVQIGQLIVSGFPGTTAPSWLRARLAERELGGVILFGYNVASRSQVRQLDRQFQSAGHGDVLIAVDQE